MKQLIETLDLAQEALEFARLSIDEWSGYASDYFQNKYDLKGDMAKVEQAITAIKQARSAPVCNPHPKAPHGFNRSASHSADRYVCECEGWDAYDAGYQAGIEDTYKRMEAIDKKAENARELGLDYEPVQELTNLQRHEQNVQKFLGAQPAPVQEPVAWLTEERYAQLHTAQRQWVGLTDEERDDISEDWATDVLLDIFEVISAIEAKLKEKNT
jgi:DNA-binding ferritin-like protein